MATTPVLTGLRREVSNPFTAKPIDAILDRSRAMAASDFRVVDNIVLQTYEERTAQLRALQADYLSLSMAPLAEE